MRLRIKAALAGIRRRLGESGDAVRGTLRAMGCWEWWALYLAYFVVFQLASEAALAAVLADEGLLRIELLSPLLLLVKGAVAILWMAMVARLCLGSRGLSLRPVLKRVDRLVAAAAIPLSPSLLMMTAPVAAHFMEFHAANILGATLAEWLGTGLSFLLLALAAAFVVSAVRDSSRLLPGRATLGWAILVFGAAYVVSVHSWWWLYEVLESRDLQTLPLLPMEGSPRIAAGRILWQPAYALLLTALLQFLSRPEDPPAEG